MSRAVTWIGLAAAAVFAVGIIVAITQPGDLGGDDEVALSTSTTQTTVADTTTAPTTAPTTVPTAAPPPTTAPPAGGTSTGPGGTSTGTGSGNGSGLGASGAGSAETGELVNSGHESLILPGLLLAGVGALTARRRRPG